MQACSRPSSFAACASRGVLGIALQLAGVLCVPALTLGCGSAFAPDYLGKSGSKPEPNDPPVFPTDNIDTKLLRIDGYIVREPRRGISEKTRAAVVWLIPPAEGRSTFLSAQEARITPKGNSTNDFWLDILMLGSGEANQASTSFPEGAFWTFKGEARQAARLSEIDENMSLALGELLLYEDGNDNGRFDIVPNDQTSPDKVMGRAEHVRVWYLNSAIPAPSHKFVGFYPTKAGFSVTLDPVGREPLPGECATFKDGIWQPFKNCELITVVPGVLLGPGNTVEFKLSDSPLLQKYSCKGYWGGAYNSSDAWPDFYGAWHEKSPLAKQMVKIENCDHGAACSFELPVKANTPITCNQSDTADAYVWRSCENDPDRCGQEICHYGHGERSRTDERPTNWPGNCQSVSSLPVTREPDAALKAGQGSDAYTPPRD